MIFVQGAARVDLGHLAGRMQRHTAYSRFYDWPPSAQAVRWVVRLPHGEAALTLRAGCPRAGAVHGDHPHRRHRRSATIEPAAARGRATPARR